MYVHLSYRIAKKPSVCPFACFGIVISLCMCRSKWDLKVIFDTMGPMEFTNWKDMGLKLTSVVVRHILIALAIGLSGPVADTSWIHSYYKQCLQLLIATSHLTPTHLPSYSAPPYQELIHRDRWDRYPTTIYFTTS